MQLVGIDPKVQPPKFDIGFISLAKSLDTSRYRRGAVFFYTIFVDENGSILGIDDGAVLDKPPPIIDTLSKSRVIKPGLRNGIPVPTAVILAIPVP